MTESMTRDTMEFPMSQALLLVRWLRGERTATTADLVRASRDLINFGVEQWLATMPTLPLSTPAAALTEEEAAKELEALCQVYDSDPAGAPLAATKFDWRAVLKLLAGLLQGWL